MEITIEDLIDLIIERCDYKFRVWSSATDQETDYNEETDSGKNVNSFEITLDGNDFVVVFNVD